MSAFFYLHPSTSGPKNVTTFVQSIKAQITIGLGISDEEFAVMAKEVSSELLEYKSFWNAEIFYGRKPVN